MRFWTSKIRTEEKSWSVILNPLKGELDKRRAAEKISELFRLSFEEARELVQSTPLILLDELPHETALQLQNIFQEIRADVTLTSDSLVKRRCYRAVWPEPPNLSFLDSPPSEALPDKQAAERPVETLIQEIPTPSVQETSLGEREEETEDLSESYQHLEKRYRDLELLYEARTRENEELKQGLEKEIKNQSEKSAAELRAAVEDWEERYQSLKGEAQETKAIYEEKILVRQKEFEALQERLKDLGLWQEKVAHLEKQNREFLEKLDELKSSKEKLDQSVREQTDAVNLWREKYQGLAQKAERFEALHEDERKRREQAEETRRQASELAERTRREIQTQTEETAHWRSKFQEIEESQKRLEQEFSQFSTEQNAEVKRLRETNHELELQLETAQRQARDLHFRVDQQELVEKRTRLAHELSTKEARLRELALESERLRQEVQDRELRTQTLSSEQANLEREILEVKQAQRHLLEQSKMKEKSHRFRRPLKNINGSEPSPENHD